MKHPTPEELVSWVYGEGSKQLSAHVKACAECRAQVETWRGTMKTLDELPAPAARRRFVWAPVQWAAAAALFVILGMVLGRFGFSSTEANVRAAVQNEVQAQVAAMRAELMHEAQARQREAMEQMASAADARIAANAEKLANEFAAALQQARAADREAYLAALNNLNNRYQTEIADLRKGIETVVAVADYGFEATGQRLAQLAAASENSRQE